MEPGEATYGELANLFADISRLLSNEPTIKGTLQRIVDCAQITIEGCDAASISLVNGEEITTPVQSNSIALEIDRFQYEWGEGPCLDAIRIEPMLYAEDLSDDQRWPNFGPAAVERGMRSLLSCRLTAGQTLGSLNMYAKIPQAYGAGDRTKALIFATHAGTALGSAGTLHDVQELLESEILRAENLESALMSRETIGQAEGILIERERITADQAFAILRRSSQNLNLKLRDLAQYVVDTGDVPKN